jgi:uncharacterized Zn-binding protein involved in type VI secretion
MSRAARAARIGDKITHGEVTERVAEVAVDELEEQAFLKFGLKQASKDMVLASEQALTTAETAEEVSATLEAAKTVGGLAKVVEAAEPIGWLLLAVQAMEAVAPDGTIMGPGSDNVFINGAKAARATDIAICVNPLHNMIQQILTGSDVVFINGTPAAKSKSQVPCGAKVVGGSSNVIYGS